MNIGCIVLILPLLQISTIHYFNAKQQTKTCEISVLSFRPVFLGNYAAAIEYYNKLTAKHSSDILWNKMGICYQHLQEYDNAIDCFQNSNNVSNNGSAWYGMGICYAKKKNHSKSMECMKSAAQLGHEEAQKLLTGMNKKW